MKRYPNNLINQMLIEAFLTDRFLNIFIVHPFSNALDIGVTKKSPDWAKILCIIVSNPFLITATYISMYNMIYFNLKKVK